MAGVQPGAEPRRSDVRDAVAGMRFERTGEAWGRLNQRAAAEKSMLVGAGLGPFMKWLTDPS